MKQKRYRFQYLIIAAALPLLFSCGKEKALVTAESGLNMRAEPKADATVVALVPGGSVVTVLNKKGPPLTVDGKAGNWMETEFQGKRGWMFSGYLNPDSKVVAAAESCAKEPGMGFFQGQCVDAALALLLRGQGTIIGWCGAQNEKFFHDGRVYVSGMYVSEPYFGSWKIAGGQLRITLKTQGPDGEMIWRESVIVGRGNELLWQGRHETDTEPSTFRHLGGSDFTTTSKCDL